ncbi:hypothetical protein PF010_g11551 [Phytophthora fragariae]|uniref:PX domain-containing protein n=1 Tax=Phytophthora fragariae TaxID=53985 RepID=A0A6G0L5M0_9STRA|nr:hypothetical protein PF010_g11551 [Phytophthora fragariae]
MKSTAGTGQATSEFIEHRRAGLERFLRKVVNHDERRNSNFFSSFLECSIVELTALKAEAQRASSVNATSMPSVVQRAQMLNNWWGKTYQRMVENDTLNLFGSRSGAEDGGTIGCERRRPGLARFRGQKAVKLKKLFLEFAQLHLRNSKELEKIVAQSATELETPLPGQAPVRRTDPCKHVRVAQLVRTGQERRDRRHQVHGVDPVPTGSSSAALLSKTETPIAAQTYSDVSRPLCNVCIFVLFLLLSATKQSPSPEAHGSTYSAPIAVNSSLL